MDDQGRASRIHAPVPGGRAGIGVGERRAPGCHRGRGGSSKHSLIAIFGWSRSITAFTLTGFGTVDDPDILGFAPSSIGATTAGTWSWYSDGSDVGLTTNDQDVDAFAVALDGRLLISTRGSVSVTGVSGADEDLLAFWPTALGKTKMGTWAPYFDGSDVGLANTSNEDLNGVWVDAAGKIYLSTLGNFTGSGVSGDGFGYLRLHPWLAGACADPRVGHVLGRLGPGLHARRCRLADHHSIGSVG